MAEPKHIAQYQIIDELGHGGFAIVYKARDPSLDQLVAVKVLRGAHAEQPNVVQRFLDEARKTVKLRHRGIVRIYAVGEESGAPYIAMEYLKGTDLSKYIKPDTQLPLKQVLSIIQRSADGIDYAHQYNVVHRDIKPANIMWDPETDSCKITDFGIARITDSSKTKTGMVLGTPSYMSPEQLAGKKVTGQSDIFSLGVMLFQMVTGKLPFTGDSMASLMYKIANEIHPAPESINPDVPRCVTVIINRAMEKDVEKRYQHGKDMVADINKCLKIIEAENNTKNKA